MNLKNLMMWGIIVLLVVGLFQLFQNPNKTQSLSKVPFSSFLKNVEDGRVVQVEIKGNNIEGILSDGTSFSTYAPNDPNLVEKLTTKGVNITASPIDDKMPSLLGVLLSWFPMLLLIGVWVFFMRQMQGGKGGAMGFGKSKAKLLSETRGKVTLPLVSDNSFAFDFPNPIAPPLPPCIWRIKNTQTPISKSMGNHDNRIPNKEGILSSKGEAVILTPLDVNFSTRFGSLGAYVLNDEPSDNIP